MTTRLREMETLTEVKELRLKVWVLDFYLHKNVLTIIKYLTIYLFLIQSMLLIDLRITCFDFVLNIQIFVR